MKQIPLLARSYIELLLQLGLLRSSLLAALVLLIFVVSLSIGVSLVIFDALNINVLVNSLVFGVLFTPAAIYFFSSLVSNFAESRQKYCDVIISLEEARASDLILNTELNKTIEKLNQEIDERERVEQALCDSMQVLEEKSRKLEKARHELAEQTSLLSSFLNASPDLIYYRNEKGQFSGGNKAIEMLTGKSQDELIGLTPWDVYPQADASEIVKTDQLVFDKRQPITYEQWLEYPNGKKACFEIYKIPFYSEDKTLLGLVGFGRDITEHKRYQEALEKASRDKTTFISTISHELRTPLNAIVGFSRQLLEGQLNKEQHDQLRTIYVSAVTLGQIFNGIIDIDKSDRGRLELFPEPTDLSELVSGIEYIGKLMAEQYGLSFSFDVLDTLPKRVLIDATRLRQILWNLLSNAFKFTAQGSVNFTLTSHVEDNQVHLEFEVEDSGLGISEAELENIFAMYYQVKQSNNNLHATGTGIGLAVSKQNAQLMGGDIRVESELNYGSTFSLSLSVPICETTPSKSIAPLKQGCKILLVEDIELNIVVASRYLEKLGHQVIVARTGQEALSLFNEHQLDYVLLDIQLPDMTGFDIAKHLRANYETLPPIIALTANVIKDRSQYLAQGMDAAISKPFTLEDLTQVLSTDFEQHEQILPQQNNVDDKAKLDAELGEALLDLPMLESYLSCVDVDAINQSIVLFEQSIEGYLSALELNLIAKDQSGIVSEAHKIKSAASAIGLKHIQEIANKAQSPQLPTWWDNIDDWVDEIKFGYQQDILVLRKWLQAQEASYISEC